MTLTQLNNYLLCLKVVFYSGVLELQILNQHQVFRICVDIHIYRYIFYLERKKLRLMVMESEGWLKDNRRWGNVCNISGGKGALVGGA